MKTSILIPLLLSVFYWPLNQEKGFDEQNQAILEAKIAQQEWVDVLYKKMSLEERIGQLINVRAHSDKGPEHVAAVEKLIKDYHVGGMTFFQGTPEKQVELTNRYQKLAKRVPIMVAIDAEWGLGMRFLKDGFSFPRQLTLGAIRDNRLIYDMGIEVARQMKRVGAHVNFAPVVDVNNNPNNPVINNRSFGEDRHNVASKGYMYMKGMQDGGILACAKHFPGHGDTDVDSHYDLPQIWHDSIRLDSIELYPFKVLAQHGVGSMMAAHLFIPAIDSTPNLPTTLSGKAINQLLREEIGYDGLVFTDGLEMKGVTKHHKTGELEVKALQAGNDILLLPENTPATVREIKKALANQTLDSLQFQASVKKVLHAKYRLGMNRRILINETNIRKELEKPKAFQLKKKLIENAITLVRSEDSILPIQDLSKLSIASVSIGASSPTAFQKRLGKYASVVHFTNKKDISTARKKSLIQQLKNYDIVLVGMHDLSNWPSKSFGVNQSMISFVEELQQVTKVGLVYFGNPYALKFFDNIKNVLLAYEEDNMFQETAAEAAFGVFAIQGRLPITASTRSSYGTGIDVPAGKRLRYEKPEFVGLNPDTLALIDDIAKEAINIKATPGCVVLTVKDGRVVYHEAFGHHTYAKKRKMQKDDIFDLASVTKIAATTISIMKLHEEGRISIEDKLGKHLKEAIGTNKENLIIKDILAHHAGLKPWIPFYKETVTDNRRNPRPKKEFYKKKKTEKFSIPVTDILFMENSYVDTVWKKIYASDLRSNNDYRYSDLGMYLMARLVKEKTGKSLDRYVEDVFYKPMGLKSTLYNPLRRFDRKRIVPTELDKYFRRAKIHGHVHDMGAAMIGGVSGHAGLFGTANDMAALMQMLLNKGKYGGKQYLKPETVQLFTTRHPRSSRRGIGFDMREIDASKSQNVSQKADYATFGHLGFTGTAVWADPTHNVITIFLSNRTYPSMNNYRLNKKDIRPRIQEVIYRAKAVGLSSY